MAPQGTRSKEGGESTGARHTHTRTHSPRYAPNTNNSDQAIVSGLPPLERSAQDLTRVFLRHCTATVQPTIECAPNQYGLMQTHTHDPDRPRHHTDTQTAVSYPKLCCRCVVRCVCASLPVSSRKALTLSETASWRPTRAAAASSRTSRLCRASKTTPRCLCIMCHLATPRRSCRRSRRRRLRARTRS